MKIDWKSIDTFVGNYSLPSQYIHRNCPICGSNNLTDVLHIKEFQFYSDSTEFPKRIDIKEQQCLKCLSIFLNPCYSNYGFSTLFSEASFSYGSTEGRTDEQISWLNSKGLINAGSSFLDVGCYDGTFLSKLPNSVKKIGVDIDKPAVERGLQKYKSNSMTLIHGNLENFRLADSVDTIVMFHVLEHVTFPVTVLKNLRLISKEKTRLVIEVPIIEKSNTNDINGFFSVQHITHFSKTSLENCLKQSGWKIIDEIIMNDYNGYRVIAEIDNYENPILSVNIYDRINLFKYLSHWYGAILKINNKLENLKDEQFVIWGGGLHVEFLYQFSILFLNNSRKFIIVDSDKNKQGKTWRGINIYDSSLLTDMNWDATFLLISSYGSQAIIEDAALKIGVPKDRVIKIYDYIEVY